ncbi:cytidine deaminase family protein [Streptomyces sp. RPT161]|uniref:cytidine deaminase family protein n=1 Tax=Streptomyces sp. RPT161 TaxID=3015993 RepID=UPI0022B8E3E0|nr:cytidine deaminase [Streptomyces sp. RPT161]
MTRRIDHELVTAATRTAQRYCRGDNHSVAAAARTHGGRIVTAVNAYHFTGGPCAELVLIGTAASQGDYDLSTMVAVADQDRGIIPPCGRCRQVLFDYFPALTVIVGPTTAPRAVSIAELLPDTYVWAEHGADADRC